MSALTWGESLLIFSGILFLICCAIIAWPRKRKGLSAPHWNVERNAYREFKS